MPSSPEHDLHVVQSANEAPVFNIAAVARRCELPAPTLRAWERRHGFPEPRRGPGHQRLYSERDVQAILWLRARIGEGLTIRAALALLRDGLSRQPSITRPVASIWQPDRSTGALARRLEQALLAFDATEAGCTLDEALKLYVVEQVCLEMIQPTLRAIGLGWQAGTIDIAQEHFASGFIRQRLAALLDVSNGNAQGRLVVAACAPDDWHELGILMVALFLARRGWRVLYLGASLPLDGLQQRLALLRPTAVVLSASTEQAATALATIARRLTDLPPPRPLFGFGGNVFEQHPPLRDAVPGLYLGPDAATAVTQLDQALAAASA